MKLIDTSPIIDNLNREIEIAENKNYFNSKQIELKAAILKMIRVYISKQPTIDAVPVVRCKDCRYWKDQAEGVVEVPVCEYDCRNGKIGITQIMGAEDYCSHGERKDDDE